jgi:nucleotide-binding universal stress UspA family protein
MIGMDLTEMDDILIKKTIVFLEFLGTEKCYFVHVSKNLAIPQEILEKYPDLVAPNDETIEKMMGEKLKQHSFPEHIEVEIFAEEGQSPLDTFLRWARIKDVDLIIMGRKETLKGSGALAHGVANKAPCSILLFQEQRPVGMPRKIMIPTDFSQHNHMIYEFGERISDHLGAQLLPIHIFEVPQGYSKTGKTYEEFAEIMKENAKNDFKKFVSKHDHPELECTMVLHDGENEGKLIMDIAKKIDADMIIMGSRGRTSSAAILLGSTAEKIIQANNSIPMMIFKKKGENMGFFEALFKI